ncbi:MAG: hypothetical protein ACT4RN_04520 [Pseudonocardia sp.]
MPLNLRVGGPDHSRLARLLDDWSVVAAVLVDVDSGMTLDSYVPRETGLDLELMGAAHADLVRGVVDALTGLHRLGPPTEVVLSHSTGLHHVVRTVPDPHGGRLAVAVLVTGSDRTVARTRRRLRRIAPGDLVPRPVSARPAHSAQPSMHPIAHPIAQSPPPDRPGPQVVPSRSAASAVPRPRSDPEPTWFTPGAAPASPPARPPTTAR